MMKKTLTLWVAGLLSALHALAQGWPAQYEGVMLQGFYWDSYADTQWTNLEQQADELSRYFSLVWVPNSAYANSLSNNMGYHPVYWFDHKSAFDTEAQLRAMIQTFRAKGTGVIEDVVINHRASVDANWLNFPAETYKGVTYQLTAADICQDDESKDNGYHPTGAKDTGEAWGGARDLDHTSQNVQQNVLAYMDCLLNDLGYEGFRYDFVKGYAPEYVALYNRTTGVKYSVGECWDGSKTVVRNWIDGTKVDGVIQSAAFDFPLKYYINDAFSQGQWSRLTWGCLADDNAYKRYAVTFVDNHDTGRSTSDGGAPLYANVEAANAYILTMPGTPCVWLSHWKTYKTAIKKLIAIRKAVGIHSESSIDKQEVQTNGYLLQVSGKRGKAMLLLGSVTTPPPSTDGYKLAVEGQKYQLYVTEDVDLSALDGIEDEHVDLPSFCTVADGETCAFFEAPTSGWTTVKCWAWDAANNYTGGSWPGQLCTLVGTNGGHKVYKWTYTGALTTEPAYIIFNDGKTNGGSQTSDLVFHNGGYYNEYGALVGIVATTGIDRVPTTAAATASAPIYTLSGQRVGTVRHPGLYIVGGRKVVVK